MSIIEHGTITNGGIALDKPLPLPEGSKVIVRVEMSPQPVEGSESSPEQSLQEIFPFFGQWADRTDIPDSAEYVRQERAKWSQRPYRQD